MSYQCLNRIPHFNNHFLDHFISRFTRLTAQRDTFQRTFHNRDRTKHLNDKSSSNDVRLPNVNVSFSLLLPTHIVVSFISRYTSFFRQFRGINFSSGEERINFLQQFPKAIARYQYVIMITQYDHAIMT